MALAIDTLSQIKQRFYTNMRRVGALTAHALSIKLEDGEPATAGDLKSDLLRANAVFLHASFEDLLRNVQPRARSGWTFNGDTDLRRALKRIPLDAASFEDLMAPLRQLARSRIRIVHFADLGALQDATVRKWGFVDEWLSGHWALAAGLFFHRLMHRLGPTTLVEDRARENSERAFSMNLEVGRLLTKFPPVPDEKRKQALADISARLEAILGSLELKVEMFLDSDGNLLPGAI